MEKNPGRKNSASNPASASVTLDGTVEKIIRSPDPSVPEKAQIGIERADELYREVRIENVLINEQGKKVALKEGAKVDVTVSADPEATTPSA